MATERSPRDHRADFDFQGTHESVPPALAALEDVADGEVRLDEYSKQLYATDASIYAVTPVGVVFPRDAADVARVVAHCADHDIPVLPRGAGTSLAGQAVNEAVVLDFSRHMDGVRSVDPDRAWCTAEPGVVLAELNETLSAHGLKFAPDPAWGDKSTLGGAIGNNSTGSHSLKYGKTEAYIESCEVVLADGTRTTFGECTLEDIAERGDPAGDLEARIYACIHRIVTEEREPVREAFPEIHRNVSGYNLDRLCTEAETGSVNAARLLAGSEGTLAIVTAATVSLEPVPATTGVALLLYEDLLDRMADVEAVLAHHPSAVEIIDDVLLDLARETEEFHDVASRLPDATEAALLVEFYAEDEAAADQQTANLIEDRTDDVPTRAEPAPDAGTDAPIRASGAFEAADRAEQDEFWKLRKSGLPILLGRTSDAKHVAFIEDTAVPVESLPAYVTDVQEVLDAHDTFASFYAHAGPGCLHIRPLVDTHTVEGVADMESIADAVTDLAIEYGGSITGEHGDGRARSPWIRKQYGQHVYGLFEELKDAFDPDGLLNPGQIVGDADLTEDLRIDPDMSFEAGFEPALEWDNENGFRGMVELCHGCGGCRGEQETTGGVMCPTYRASAEEITATRGRANLLRQAMTGELPNDAAGDPEFLREVMDLCIGCKGCARDCPSEVDMARLKVEVTHAHHREHGVDLRTRLFANVHRIGAIGSTLAPVSNWMTRLPGAGWMAEKTLGIAREQELPRFRRDTFLDRVEARPAGDGAGGATDAVLLLPDVTTNYHEPEIATAAVAVLQAADVDVAVPDRFLPTGRPAYSMGMVETARERAARVVEALEPAIAAGRTIVTVEPSDAAMLGSDYAALLGPEASAQLAGHTVGLMEYLDRSGLAVPEGGQGTLTYHGHCHDKATNRAAHATHVLEAAGWDVDQLDSGCCGMAGSFGYEAEHYAMSKAIAGILYDQVDASPGGEVVATGASCRNQLRDHLGTRPAHPVELLEELLD